jgi:carbonic anhydrase
MRRCGVRREIEGDGGPFFGGGRYAGHHLHVPLLVVLGHEGCGAVIAALGAKFGRAHEPERIEALVR